MKLKTHYGNIKYALHNQWLWAKERVIFTMVKTPIVVLASLLQLYFPAMIVSGFEKGHTVMRICATIVAYLALCLALNLIENYRYSRSEKYRYFISNVYQMKLAEKHWRTDYENTENPNINQEYNMAYADSMGECAPDEVLNTLVDLFVSLLGVITYSGVILSFSVYFIFPVVFSAVVTYITGQYQVRYYDKHARDNEFFERKMSYINDCERNMKSAKEVRVFSLAKWFDGMYVQNMLESFRIMKKSRAFNTKVTLINTAAMLIQNAVIYTVLTIQIVNGEISASDYIFLLGLVTGFSAWFIGIINQYNHIIGQAVAIQHYRNYLELNDRTGGRHADIGEYNRIPPEIVFENVGYRYLNADKKLYEGFNMKISSGEKIAIVGENGAGKTTLVKLLCGLYKAQEGEIYIDGQPCSEIATADYFDYFSVVFQDMYMLPMMIKEFVAATDEGISEDRVIDSLKKVGLYEKVMSLPGGIETPLMKGVREGAVDLSGGEVQKLMLARAFYKNAPILILDEPSAALDPIAERNLYGFINENTADKTVVFISHRLASTRFCDRIFVIDDGKIAECGSHDELMEKKGRYAEMFELQSRYYKSGDELDEEC